MERGKNEINGELCRKIRELYGLSRITMSRVLGFGVNQWRRYEDEGDEPNKSNRLMILMVKDPLGMKKIVENNDLVLERELGKKRVEKLKLRISELVGRYNDGERLNYEKWVDGLYEEA